MIWHVKEMIAGDFKIVLKPTFGYRWVAYSWGREGWRAFGNYTNLERAKQAVIQQYEISERNRGVSYKHIRTPKFKWIIVEFVSGKSKIRMSDDRGNPTTRKIPTKRLWQISFPTPASQYICHVSTLRQAKEYFEGL